MDEKEKAIAALKALAEGDDEKMAEAAKAALVALRKGDEPDAEGDDKVAEDTDSKDESKAESEPKSEPAMEEKKEDPKAMASLLALANQVQKLTAKVEASENKEERAKLLASRPDFAPDVLALMRTAPLSVVRDAVKTLAKGAGAGKGQVAAAISAIGVASTRGDSQSARGSHALPADEKHALDVQMGLAAPTSAIRHEGTRLVLGVMTPSEARAARVQKGTSK